MFTHLENLDLFPLTGAEILRNIVVALLCGLAIGRLYRMTYRGPGYSVAFVDSLALLAMITAVVILIIGNNLARAFGLVGAMSIIRFRTAIKDTLDIVYIFFALVVGMAAGAGYYKIAILATVAVGMMIYVLAKARVSASRRADGLLQFAYSPNGSDEAGYLPVLRKYCRRHTVVNTRSLGSDRGTLELSFYVDLRDKQGSEQFVQALRGAEGVTQVNLYFDEEEF
jgi:uncharacterized protein DUF4956